MPRFGDFEISSSIPDPDDESIWTDMKHNETPPQLTPSAPEPPAHPFGAEMFFWPSDTRITYNVIESCAFRQSGFNPAAGHGGVGSFLALTVPLLVIEFIKNSIAPMIDWQSFGKRTKGGSVKQKIKKFLSKTTLNILNVFGAVGAGFLANALFV